MRFADSDTKKTEKGEINKEIIGRIDNNSEGKENATYHWEINLREKAGERNVTKGMKG